MSFTPSGNDWQRLYQFCERQALLGIGFTAVERLHGMGVECPKPLMMRWMAMALQIEKRNEALNGQCRKLTERYGHDGLRCCILKGQGNLLNYPEPLRRRRTPGDIDVWTAAGDAGISIAVQTGENSADYVAFHGRKAVIEYVRQQHRLSGNDEGIELRYHHIDAPKIGDTSVEAHFRVGFCNSPLRNMRMQRWFSLHAGECMENMTQMGFAVPTASVNVVYQMTHLFSHYFDEGIGLRQMVDYYYALKALHDGRMENEGIMQALRSFGMAKFAAAVMWVLQAVFAMPDDWLICVPEERRGRELLHEIMQAGNFGQYDERGREMKNGGMASHAVWKMRRIMRLVRNYPEEALCEPFFRIWHWGWRMVH